MSHKVEHIAGKLLGKLGVDINQQRRDYGHQQPMYAPPPMPPPHLINAQYQGQHQPTGVVPGFEPEPHLLSVSPLPPPRVNTATRPSPALPLTQPSQHRAGVIYAPGTYPTPELFPFPLGNHTVLSNPSSYTCRAIQDALDALGPQSTLYLPKRSRWAVSKTIYLKPYQEIATEGYPTNGEEMGWLDATEELEKHLLSGFCVAGVRIRNIGVDGGREKFGELHAHFHLCHPC
ncbi:hypothetical protein FRC02_005914 [Tulasnella sp. 418]|nr:hypothetical protein FRC02_005914 [Tulasnella sp. 418]